VCFGARGYTKEEWEGESLFGGGGVSRLQGWSSALFVSVRLSFAATGQEGDDPCVERDAFVFGFLSEPSVQRGGKAKDKPPAVLALIPRFWGKNLFLCEGGEEVRNGVLDGGEGGFEGRGLGFQGRKLGDEADVGVLLLVPLDSVAVGFGVFGGGGHFSLLLRVGMACRAVLCFFGST
jgi:hypothetical protein